MPRTASTGLRVKLRPDKPIETAFIISALTNHCLHCILYCCNESYLNQSYQLFTKFGTGMVKKFILLLEIVIMSSSFVCGGKVIPESYGLSVRGGTCRGLHCVKNADGRDSMVLWLMDRFCERVLQIDAETGEAESIPIPGETDFAPFVSLCSRAGKSYSLFCHYFLEFDPELKKFTFVEKVGAGAGLGMGMMEDEAGNIWCSAYPDCHLFRFDPVTREFKSYGQINKTDFPQYPYTMVKEGNIIYIGIGFTCGQVVRYDPESGKSEQIIPENLAPAGEPLKVYRYSDGNVYASGKKTAFIIKDGKAEVVKAIPADVVPLVDSRTGDAGMMMKEFPSGRKLVEFDVKNGTFVTTAADGSDRKEVKFFYENRGTSMMDITVNDQGIAAGGGSFPFWFGKLDCRSGEKTVEFAGVQCNAITSHGKYFYIAAYHGGQLLKLDPDQPWTLKNAMKIDTPDLNSNPVFYGAVRNEICRPHAITVAPDGSYFVAGGTPAYGTTGGGIAFVDTASGKIEVVPHTKLAVNEAPHALLILDDELLLCGTAVYPGTGGRQLATEGSLFIYDMKEKRTIWQSKALGKLDAVFQLLQLDEKNVLGYTSNDEVFLFNVPERKIVYQKSIAEVGPAAMAGSCRALLKSPDGRLFFLGKKHIAQIDPENGSIVKAVEVSGGIQMSGAVYGGKVWFASENQWKSVPLP